MGGLREYKGVLYGSRGSGPSPFASRTTGDLRGLTGFAEKRGFIKANVEVTEGGKPMERFLLEETDGGWHRRPLPAPEASSAGSSTYGADFYRRRGHSFVPAGGISARSLEEVARVVEERKVDACRTRERADGWVFPSMELVRSRSSGEMEHGGFSRIKVRYYSVIFGIELANGRRQFSLEKGRGSLKDVLDRTREIREILKSNGAGGEADSMVMSVLGDHEKIDSFLLVKNGGIWKKEPMAGRSPIEALRVDLRSRGRG